MPRWAHGCDPCLPPPPASGRCPGGVPAARRLRHPAPHPLHNPHNVGVPPPRRHKVDHLHFAFRRLKTRLDNQCPRAILPPASLQLRLRCDLPEPVIARPQQRRKTGARRKCRPAHPVDRALPRNQCCCLAVSDQRIIFNLACMQWRRSSARPFVCSRTLLHVPSSCYCRARPAHDNRIPPTRHLSIRKCFAADLYHSCDPYLQ